MSRSFASPQYPHRIRLRRAPAKERTATLVLNPLAKGSVDPVRDGALGEEAMVATVLEPVGLTRAEARNAGSYQPGQIVAFREGAGKGQPRSGIGYRVDSVDAEAGTVRLLGPRGKQLTWSPSVSGGDQADAFVGVPQEFRTGDRVQFTRNNYAAKRLNGHSATVVALDVAGGTMLVERHQDGQRQQLDMAKLADRHVRPGWVQTIHAAQGATAERVMAHLESFRTNTVDTRAAYLAISRARSHAALYTDSRAKLAEALGLRKGTQVGALDEIFRRGMAIESI
jgi:hypothetical protein